MIAVKRPAEGGRPEAMAIAMDSGSATIGVLPDLLWRLCTRPTGQCTLGLDFSTSRRPDPLRDQCRRHLAMKLHAQVRKTIALDHERLTRAQVAGQKVAGSRRQFERVAMPLKPLDVSALG